MSMACNLYWPLGRSGTVQARSLQYGRTGTDLVSVKSDLVVEKSDIVVVFWYILKYILKDEMTLKSATKIALQSTDCVITQSVLCRIRR